MPDDSLAMPVTEALFRTIVTSMLIIGVVLWVRALLQGRVQPWLDGPSRLPAWSIGLGDFLLLPLVVLLLLVFVPYGLGQLLGIPATHPPTVEAVMVAGFGMGIAFIGGTMLFRCLPEGHPPESREGILHCMAVGLLALIYFLPVCTGLALGWSWLLDVMGVAHDRQDIVKMIQETSNPGMITLWLLIVVVIAPIGEELVFRAGIFRFLVNRMSPGFAATLSAIFFTVLHWNLQAALPLFVLGMVLAGLYHKTGRIITAIVLHASFNLNTFLGILSGAVE